MSRTKNTKEDRLTAFLFVLIPAIFVIIGILFFPFPLKEDVKGLLSVPNFIGLILLGIGFFVKNRDIAGKIRICGWGFIAFFWSTQINSLYFGEEGDAVNTFFCAAGVFVLLYVAYHEWLSLKRKEDVSCLNWIAGAGVVAGFIYFGIEMTSLEMWLREVVASQSAGILNVFTGNVYQKGTDITWGQASVGIIFACTAVQSMVLFVGMILPLTKVNIKRKFYGLLITVVPVYFLNLVRNALVVYLTGAYGTDFFPIAHNVIAKGLGLLALVILLLILIKIVPEIFDEIVCLIDIHKRNGPIERFVKRYVLGKKL